MHLTKNVAESFSIISEGRRQGELGFELREQGWDDL